MALIACPECQKQVSDAAPACPHCGYPVQGAALPGQPVLRNAGFWKHAATVLGLAATAPWIARALALVAAVIMFVILFGSKN